MADAWRFIAHNRVRSDQFETILSEMKKDYQEMYEALPDTPFMMTRSGLTRKIQYMEQEIYNQDEKKEGSSIAVLSMVIQKGKYDGTDETCEK